MTEMKTFEKPSVELNENGHYLIKNMFGSFNIISPEFDEETLKKLNFSEFMEADKENDVLYIQGIGLCKGINSSYITFKNKALTQGAEKSTGKPIFYDHFLATENIVGKMVTAKNHRKLGLTYLAEISKHHPKQPHIQAELGHVNTTSYHFVAESIKCSICKNEVYECDHYLGNVYENKKGEQTLAVAVVQDIQSVVENSLTWAPVDTAAQFVKASKLTTDEEEDEEDEEDEGDFVYTGSLEPMATAGNTLLTTLALSFNKLKKNNKKIIKKSIKLSEPTMDPNKEDLTGNGNNETEVKLSANLEQKEQEILALEEKIALLQGNNEKAQEGYMSLSKKFDDMNKRQLLAEEDKERAKQEETIDKILVLSSIHDKETLMSFSKERIDTLLELLEEQSIELKKRVPTSESRVGTQFSRQPGRDFQMSKLSQQVGDAEANEKINDVFRVALGIVDREGNPLRPNKKIKQKAMNFHMTGNSNWNVSQHNEMLETVRNIPRMEENDDRRDRWY